MINNLGKVNQEIFEYLKDITKNMTLDEPQNLKNNKIKISRIL